MTRRKTSVPSGLPGLIATALVSLVLGTGAASAMVVVLVDPPRGPGPGAATLHLDNARFPVATARPAVPVVPAWRTLEQVTAAPTARVYRVTPP